VREIYRIAAHLLPHLLRLSNFRLFPRIGAISGAEYLPHLYFVAK
jgi:hypothetical protein